MLCIHMTKKLLRWSVGTILQAGLEPTKKAVYYQHQAIRQLVCCIFIWSLCRITYTREFQANEFVRSKNNIPVVDVVKESALNCKIADSFNGEMSYERNVKMSVWNSRA